MSFALLVEGFRDNADLLDPSEVLSSVGFLDLSLICLLV